MLIGAENGHPPRARLTTSAIVCLVMAVVTPVGAIVSTTALAIALAGGAGMPGVFVLAAAVLFCFSAGYAAMSRRITNAGAFYTYITQGLGRGLGTAAAFVAVLSYNAIFWGLSGAFGYFARVVAGTAGLQLPWWVFSLAGYFLIALLGRRAVDLSARLLAALLLLEIAVIMMLDIAILFGAGLSAFSLSVFAPRTVLAGAPGIALMFAFNMFQGFEATAIFGEETRDPDKSVPRATYLSVGVIAVFYTLTSWALISGSGTGEARAAAASDTGDYVLNLTTRYAGVTAHDVLGVLVVSSMFAAMLALHNAAARYFFALGRDRLLPAALGRSHPRWSSPAHASLVQILAAAVVVAVFAAAGADPLLQLATMMAGLGTVGVVLLQGFTSIAVIRFFWRRADRRWWATVVAPAVGAAGLLGACWLAVTHYSILTQSHSTAINSLPWLLPAAATAGLCYARWLRRHRPQIYRAMASATRPPTHCPEASRAVLPEAKLDPPVTSRRSPESVLPHQAQHQGPEQ